MICGMVSVVANTAAALMQQLCNSDCRTLSVLAVHHYAKGSVRASNVTGAAIA